MSTTASKEQQLSRERQELASQQAEVAALREENQKKHSQEKQKNIEALHKCLESFDSFETLSLSEFFLGVGEMLTWPAKPSWFSHRCLTEFFVSQDMAAHGRWTGSRSSFKRLRMGPDGARWVWMGPDGCILLSLCLQSADPCERSRNMKNGTHPGLKLTTRAQDPTV